MRKFGILLKKEIRELITLQLILPLVITVVLFLAIGQTIGSEIEKIEARQPVIVADMDNTEVSSQLVAAFESAGVRPILAEESTESALLSKARAERAIGVIIIPSGLTSAFSQQHPVEIVYYSVVDNFSVLGNAKVESLNRALAAGEEFAKINALQNSGSNFNQEFFSQPIVPSPNVAIGDKVAAANPGVVLGFIGSQSTFIPIILFIVILLASQLIATAIATEKETKTLETLLSAPVARTSIVAAKLVGAGIVAGLMAIVYMFGFRSYLGGFTGGASDLFESAEIQEILQSLGLLFSTGDFVLLGLSLFFGVLAALSIALLLGAFTEDVKSVPGVISPLMVLIAIPYFLSFFVDFNTLTPALRFFVYAIPFSHPFLASSNIFLGNYSAVWYGILYQLGFFLVFVWIASRVFASDKILTMKLNFFKKKS